MEKIMNNGLVVLFIHAKTMFSKLTIICLAVLVLLPTAACTSSSPELTKQGPAGIETAKAEVTCPAQSNIDLRADGRLSYAKPYLIVDEGNIANEDKQRTAGLWFIISQEADSFEEYAQTAIQAAIDLYTLYRQDFTAVMLVPWPGMATPYAEAVYTTDGKGALGMTGSAPAVPMYWRVRAMDDLQYTGQELAVAELWRSKLVDFPSQNPLSSLSYDDEALRRYIAETLHISYAETQVRPRNMVEYRVDECFGKSPAGQEALVTKPHSEAVLATLEGKVEFTEAEKAKINGLTDKLPQEVRQQFVILYETAEEVSHNSRWMAYSSWRPYVQSVEYQQLLQLCRDKGQAIWPLLFLQLDSHNPYFAGGLIIDSTLPEYLCFLERTGIPDQPDGRNQNMVPEETVNLMKYVRALLALL